MHRLLVLFLILITLAGGYWYLTNNKEKVSNTVLQTIQNVEQNGNMAGSPNTSDSESLTVIAQNLDTPWAVCFLPDNSMLVTERKGTVQHVDVNGDSSLVVMHTIVQEIGEGGLLGIAIHPDFASNSFVYLYYTYKGSDNGNTLNRVARRTYKNNELSDEKIIVDAIPGSSNHNGGRIKFGPDKMLYVGTGDAQEPSRAQDTNNLAGKILRVTDTGDPAPGNPFNNRIYSYGHRNVQGLAWDSSGQLWATEHGPSGASSCCDELNKIEIGKNYGWPTIQDTKTKEGMVAPVKSSGKVTWAPSGLAYVNGSLYFSGLRGETLYQAVLSGSSITSFKEHFKGQYGRLREVILGPDGMLYVTTSNQDGRGTPKVGDDKILRINPAKL